MFKPMLTFIFVNLVLLCGAAHAAAPGVYGLRITQSVVGIGSPVSNIFSEKAPINFGAGKSVPGVLNDPQQKKSLRETAGLSISVKSYGDGSMDKASIAQDAVTYMNMAKANQIASAIKPLMAQSKVATGVFVFEQQVRPAGVTRDMKLSWAVTVAANGNIIFPAPQVVDADPTIVYMMYTSNSTETGLPTNWTWSDHGILAWQLRRKDGTPTTPWTKINTMGALDSPESDSEIMISCIANNAQPGCPQSYPDAKSLMTTTSSAAAIIDYVRKVTPYYDMATDANGQPVYLPRVAVSYDSRNYSMSGCSAGTYRNTGRKGYTLKTTIDRYRVLEKDLMPFKINSFEGSGISPTETFDISQSSQLKPEQLNPLVIDSYGSGQLVGTSSVMGLQYVAPITQSTNFSVDSSVSFSSPYSDMTFSWDKTGPADYSLYFGTLGDNYWGGWFTIYDRTLTMNLIDSSIFTKFMLSMVEFDDFAMVQVNGQTVYVGPYGGDRLNVVQVPYYVEDPDYGGYWVNTPAIEYAQGKYVYTSELSRNWWMYPSVDLTPYLRNGANTILLRTIVGDRGEGAIRIDATTCLQ